jgi:hypothetical protein
VGFDAGWSSSVTIARARPFYCAVVDRDDEKKGGGEGRDEERKETEVVSIQDARIIYIQDARRVHVRVHVGRELRGRGSLVRGSKYRCYFFSFLANRRVSMFSRLLNRASSQFLRSNTVHKAGDYRKVIYSYYLHAAGAWLVVI